MHAARTSFTLFHKPAITSSLCNLTSHPHSGSRVPYVKENKIQFRRGHWRSSVLHPAMSTHATSEREKKQPFSNCFHTTQRKKTHPAAVLHQMSVFVYLHTALRLLNGVVQQTLESTLKRPALLHQRLITEDTQTVFREDGIQTLWVLMTKEESGTLMKHLIEAWMWHVYTHSCCKLCLGVMSGGTEEGFRSPSGLPLTGLRTLLCTRKGFTFH